MPWYAAHLICYFQFQDGNQDTYPVWEHVVLIEAASFEAATQEASRIGREAYAYTTDHGTTWEGRPVNQVFAGVRKVISCDDTVPLSQIPGPESASWRPHHGTEITYLQLEVSTAEALQQLVAGDPVQVRYEE